MPDPEKGHSFGACLTFFRVRNLFADPHGRRAKRSLTVIDLNPFRIRNRLFIHTLASGISDIGLLGMIFVSPDNHLDELVAHYVLLRKVNELDALQV